MYSNKELFLSLLRNSGNIHQINLVAGAETVSHSSTYIILYLSSLNTTLQHTNRVLTSLDALFIERVVSETGIKGRDK